MTKTLRNFADMIFPVLPRRFLAECWERQPLHIVREAPRFHDGLLSVAQVEAAIASGGLRFPSIQLAKGGGFLPPEAFTRTLRSGGDLFTGVPDLARVRAEYAGGATISLPGFQRGCAAVGALAAAIETEFTHPTHANVYLTPANAAGFSPHFDTHEVFILQIAGSKNWRVHAPPLELPHRSQNFDAGPHATAKPLLELELQPGDLLYLPRGFVHSTTTSGSFSLHVTLGITVYTWVELVTEWAQTSRALPACRRALPPGFARGTASPAAMREAFMALLADIQTHGDVDAFLAAFCQRVLAAGADAPLFRADPTRGP